MIDLDNLLKNYKSFCMVEKLKHGGIIRVPFFHWPEKTGYYLIGIFESDGKTFLTDLGETKQYLTEQKIDLKDYSDKYKKIKIKFDISEGVSNSLKYEIARPNSDDYIVLCISRFLQALSLLTYINLY